MPSKLPSTQIWKRAATMLGCDEPSIRAVFEVEASGKFFWEGNRLPQRFEPHHFPRKYWHEIGFNPGGVAAWRASLKISARNRVAMYKRAHKIDEEAAYRATSWGAPQIMGFNHVAAGYETARDMVLSFRESADKQIMGFVAFVQSSRQLTAAIRTQDWLSFAAGYNGSGQAPKYAGLIESAYRRHSGGVPSSPVLRLGSKGDAVAALQIRLNELGWDIVVDGHFGVATKNSVIGFQRERGLVSDGVAGGRTFAALAKDTGKIIVDEADQKPTHEDAVVDKIKAQGPVLATAGAALAGASQLNDNAQVLLIGGAVLALLAIVAFFVLRKKKD